MNLRHQSDGDGPVLLLGSALGTTMKIWDEALSLTARLRVVRFDHRGHGASPTPPPPYEIADLGRDVLALMDQLQIERASVGGVSLGGMVGMWLAANAPERVDRLVLVCTSPHMPQASIWSDRARAVLAAGTVEAVADGVLDRWLTPEFAAANPSVRDEVRQMLVDTDPVGYAGCCGAIERMDLRGELSRIQAATLVISGRDDAATPIAHQRLIAEGIPDARHEIVGPAAHLAPVEQPEIINRLIVEHIS